MKRTDGPLSGQNERSHQFSLTGTVLPGFTKAFIHGLPDGLTIHALCLKMRLNGPAGPPGTGQTARSGTGKTSIIHGTKPLHVFHDLPDKWLTGSLMRSDLLGKHASPGSPHAPATDTPLQHLPQTLPGRGKTGQMGQCRFSQALIIR